MWKCPNCETENLDENVLCAVCGSEKKLISSITPPTPVVQETIVAQSNTIENGWYCRACGIQNAADAYFCKRCGTKKDEFTKQPSYTPPSPSKPSVTQSMVSDLNYKMAQAEGKAKTLRTLAVLCLLLTVVMFFVPYATNCETTNGIKDVSIFGNMQGDFNGEVQVASIVLLVMTLLPIPFLCMKLTIQRRNQPLTVSLISGICAIIYCATILFGSVKTIGFSVWCIAMLMALVPYITHRYVKMLKEIDNLLFSGASL